VRGQTDRAGEAGDVVTVARDASDGIADAVPGIQNSSRATADAEIDQKISIGGPVKKWRRKIDLEGKGIRSARRNEHVRRSEHNPLIWTNVVGKDGTQTVGAFRSRGKPDLHVAGSTAEIKAVSCVNAEIESFHETETCIRGNAREIASTVHLLETPGWFTNGRMSELLPSIPEVESGGLFWPQPCAKSGTHEISPRETTINVITLRSGSCARPGRFKRGWKFLKWVVCARAMFPPGGDGQEETRNAF
jgi:hypothetical protein